MTKELFELLNLFIEAKVRYMLDKEHGRDPLLSSMVVDEIETEINDLIKESE